MLYALKNSTSMKIVKLILIFALVLPIATLAGAQSDTLRTQVIQLLENTRQRYLQTGGIQMTVRYYYANEHAPAVYLDSVEAALTMRGDNYRMKTKAVETVVNKNYSVTLFEEDQLMYLAKPAGGQTKNPLAAIDSLLLNKEGIHYAIHHKNQQVEAVLTFDASAPYKQISFMVDTATGYLVASKMLVKSTFLMPDADAATLKNEGYDEYAIVETRISDCRIPVIPADYFSEIPFFTRTGNRFEVTASYSNYKIFVATPNL